jgi:hypothetical protein
MPTPFVSVVWNSICNSFHLNSCLMSSLFCFRSETPAADLRDCSNCNIFSVVLLLTVLLMRVKESLATVTYNFDVYRVLQKTWLLKWNNVLRQSKLKVKVKLFMYLTTHHAKKTYWGSGGIARRILYLGTRWKWVVIFAPRQLYPQEKSPWYPLDRRLGGPQRRSGCGGEEENSQPPSRIEP